MSTTAIDTRNTARAGLNVVDTAALSSGCYRELGRRAGLTPQHVSRVLRGIKGASLHVAARIASAADITIDALYAHIAAQPKLRVRGRRTLGEFSKARLARRQRLARLARLNARRRRSATHAA